MKMDELKNRKTTRLKGADYNRNQAVFLTICTKERRCILSRIVGTGVLDGPQIELTTYGQIADKYIGKMNAFYENLTVDKYVIMPDHIHLLLTINEPDGHPGRGVPTRTSVIARFVGTLKRFCNKEYGENIWQSRYYDHVIRNQQDYNEVWEYIENNPRKWIVQNQGCE